VWRPREAQRKLFFALYAETKKKNPEWGEEEIRTEVLKYVNEGADPKLIPPHATGGTADLTLVDANGAELDMGTGFDHFGMESAPFYFEERGLNPDIVANRTLLREAMLAGGFCPWPYEWWHYEYGTQNWTLTYKKPFAFYGLTG
jgi:D-alanyl-D-alanine dipeptidase